GTKSERAALIRGIFRTSLSPADIKPEDYVRLAPGPVDMKQGATATEVTVYPRYGKADGTAPPIPVEATTLLAVQGKTPARNGEAFPLLLTPAHTRFVGTDGQAVEGGMTDGKFVEFLVEGQRRTYPARLFEHPQGVPNGLSILPAVTGNAMTVTRNLPFFPL